MISSLESLAAGYRERVRADLVERPYSGGDLRGEVRERVRDALRRDRMLLAPADTERLVTVIADEIAGIGPLEELMRDPAVTEVIANGPFDVYSERGGQLRRESVGFQDEAHLRHVIERIVGGAGRRVDESNPMVDARLPDGSRVNAVLPPLAVDGPLLTIRKFSPAAIRMCDLVDGRSLNRQQAELIAGCVRARLNLVVSGGTGSGKTTLLNAVAEYIDPAERIVTVEDAAELRLGQPHVARLEARPANVEGRGEVGVRALVRNALRMRPDRIVVGEVRGGEALDMLQAMNTGHDGSLTTVHANSPVDALRRIETMVLMAGLDLPLAAVREQSAAAIDVVVHVARRGDGHRSVRWVEGWDERRGELRALDPGLLEQLAGRRCGRIS